MPEGQEYLRILREEDLHKLRRRMADLGANELQEQRECEALEIVEATRIQEEVAKVTWKT